MSENNQLPVPSSRGEIIIAVASQLSILKKIIPVRKKTVLVVEDDELANRIICECIHKRFADKVETIVFFNGKTAYEYLLGNHSNVHLITSGIMMPMMNGQQLLELCKELNPLLPVILMSGPIGFDMVSRGVAADAYITKPFRIEELLNTVEKFLFAVDIAHEWFKKGKAAIARGENAPAALMRKHWHEARVAFTKAIELKPGYADAYYHRGCSSDKLGNNQQAINDYKIAASLGYKDAQDLLIKKDIQW